jgi:RND superfamily putative drug exporter
MTSTTPALALMLGLAVGIDYALFLVHRHRQQLAQGVELRESIARAVGTAGGAVLFAGLTVVIALSALTVTHIPFLGVMGLAAAGTVAAAILVNLTLTPALLRLLGPRVLSPRGRRRIAARTAAKDAKAIARDARVAAASAGKVRTGGGGWGRLVTRHPLLTIVATVLVLGVVAIPAASLKLGLPDGSSEPHTSTAYQAYSKVSDAFGPGQNAAVIAVATVDKNEARRLTTDSATDLQLTIAEDLKDTPDVVYVVPASISKDRRTMVFQIVPRSGPNDDATIALVNQLRDDRGAIIDKTPVTSIGFAGQTVANIDISQKLADALPTYLAVVVGISLVLLLLVFRSIVVPLLATGGFLLSIAAAMGAVVAVYQWGWLGSVFGVEQPGLILSFLPTLAIGILFGLAMDYQMFLVSGMREAWTHGQPARTAVRTGFSNGAKVVTAAALIMTAVFSSFVFSDQTMIKPIGFVLAVGVLVDAFGVRMTLMPAFMHLLGEKAWYLPRGLARVLPDLDIEGTRLMAAVQPATPAADEPPIAEPVEAVAPVEAVVPVEPAEPSGRSAFARPVAAAEPAEAPEPALPTARPEFTPPPEPAPTDRT